MQKGRGSLKWPYNYRIIFSFGDMAILSIASFFNFFKLALFHKIEFLLKSASKQGLEIA